MTDKLSQYACDNCRSRKIACSREVSGCNRCIESHLDCAYSRAGVLRRNRAKRKIATPSVHKSGSTGSSNGPITDEMSGSEYSSLRSQLESDIDATREQLQHMPAAASGFLGALSSLSQEYEAFWRDGSENGGSAEGARSDKGYFLFEEHAQAWAKMFVAATKTGRPLLTDAPSEVIEHFAKGRPDSIRQRAWLVMFYGVVLTKLSTTGAADANTKAKLRSNLWLAMNDVRLLLEPSDLNIQALTLLACHVEEFTTPSLCWMLVSNASRMLQALGINQKHFDAETHQRRNSLFWTLNGLDKPLALMFGRTPTFHRATMEEVPLPTIQQLLKAGIYQEDDRAILTAAHFMHQWNCLTKVMGDVWSVLYENSAGGKTLNMVKDGLESWYRHAIDVLEASALAEKPLLGDHTAEKIEGAMDGLRFQYCYLSVMLTRSHPQWTDECVRISRQMLRLLTRTIPDFEEPFNGIGVTWQLLYSPFAPFFALYRRILTRGVAEPEAKKNMEAMEHLVTFLEYVKPRHHQAGRLERICSTFTQHARSIVYPDGVTASHPSSNRPRTTQQAHPFTDVFQQSQSAQPLIEGSSSLGQTTSKSATHSAQSFPFAGMVPAGDSAGVGSLPTELDLDQLLAWIPQQEAFGETMFDWLAWDSQVP